MRYNPFPKKKSHLSPLGKTIAAAEVVHAVKDGHLEWKEAGQALREMVGLQWTLLTAMQYLTGKEAGSAVAALPDGWTDDDMTIRRLIEAIWCAADFCANAHPKGVALSGAVLVSRMRPDGDIGQFLQELRRQFSELDSTASLH